MAGSQGIRAGKAFVELYTNDDKLVRGLRSAQRRLKRFGQTITTIGKQMAIAGAVIAAPLALSLKIGANFADQMSKVKAVTEGSVEAFEKLNKTAKELGRTTSFTATQVAEGMVNLGRAGFARDEIDKSIPSILNLARATDTDLAMAAEIAGGALRQFDMDASQAGRTADVLTATANGSAQTLEDLGESLKYVAPIASEAGESIEGVSASLGIMGNNGIKGSMAGTSLARAYKNLSSDKTAKTMASIGVAVADANGDLLPMADILRDIGVATENMGSKQRLSIFEELFGRGEAAALKLANSGLKYDDMLAKINKSGGLAASTAAEMDDNLGGSFRMFMSALEGVAIAIKDALDAPLRKALKGVTGFLGKITEWIEYNQGLVITFAAISAALMVAGSALIVLGTTVSIVSLAVGGLATLVSFLGTIIAAIASPVGIVVGLLAGLVVGLLKSSAATEWLTKAFGPLYDQFKETFAAMKTALTNGDIAAAAKVVWASLNLAWVKGTNGILEIWNNVLLKMKTAWSDIVGELSNVILKVSGNAEAIAESDNITKQRNRKFAEENKVSSAAAEARLKKAEEEYKDAKTNVISGPQKEEDEGPLVANKPKEVVIADVTGISFESPANKQPLGSGGGSALQRTISFINRSTENKTVDQIRETNVLLAQVYDQLKKNKLSSLEAG